MQNLATSDLTIVEVAHSHSFSSRSKPDSSAMRLVCGGRPLAKVVTIKNITFPSHFDVSTEDNIHILIVLLVSNHVENLSHILVEPVAVYQISVRVVGGGLLIIRQLLNT